MVKKSENTAKKKRNPREPLSADALAAAERLPLEPAAKFIGPDLSVHTLRSWARQGKVAYVKAGRRLYFEKRDLLDLIRRCRVEPEGEGRREARTASFVPTSRWRSCRVSG